jgi:hypothetical protein
VTYGGTALLSSGAGGGGSDAANATFAGGNVTASTFTPLISGGTAAGQDGADGFVNPMFKPFFCAGGAGGASNGTGTGGNGGRAGFGCGGGGGGAGVTGGRGGDGGPGLVLVWWW